MQNKTILTLAILLTSFIGYSQFNYSIKLSTLNGFHPKKVLNDISKKIDIYNKHYEQKAFYFESKVLLTEEQISKIISSEGYIIEEFKVISRKEEHLGK